jgi:ABC-2 type transport system ATP-binding protein
MGQTRLLLALLVLLGLLVAPAAAAKEDRPAQDDRPQGDRVGAGAPYAFTERDVQIPVPDPDLYGDPVVLDARVTVPVGEGPFAGLVVNHGYLGSKTGDGELARKAASLGYIVLRYSSRGFGQTKGQVDLVGPKEQRDLLAAVDWLNENRDLPIWKDHIGQYGGSYGGAHALALARSGHPAVRAVIAAATWTDAYAGLVPNGVLKQAYLTGFYGAGRLRQDGYNNYEPAVDLAYAKASAGVDLDGLRAYMDERSAVGKWDDVRTPVFFAQGLNDGLFDGNAGIDGFLELQRRGVPTRLYLGGLGHPPARAGGGAEIARVEQQAVDWLDHHVRGIQNGIDRASPVEFARTQWFGNDTEGAVSRLAAAATYPFGAPVPLALCGTGPGRGTLSTEPCPAASPVVLASGTGGDPTSEPVGGRLLGDGFRDVSGRPFPSAATPVDVAVFESAPLEKAVDYAGVPTLDLQVLAGTTGAPVPSSGAVAFQAHPKLYDVAPDGTARLITRGAYAEQAGGAAGPHRATYDAFAFAWRFQAGHRLRLTLSSADVPYLRPANNPFAVAVLPGSRVLLPGAEEATAPLYEQRPR